MGGPHTKKRTAKGRFAPGSSGNPGGRPRGLAARIRDLTKDGQEMIDLHLQVLRGKIRQEHVVGTQDGPQVVEIGPSVKDRQASANWLGDRLWGKALDRVEVSELDKRAEKYAAMTREELLAAITAVVTAPGAKETK